MSWGLAEKYSSWVSPTALKRATFVTNSRASGLSVIKSTSCIGTPIWVITVPSGKVGVRVVDACAAVVLTSISVVANVVGVAKVADVMAGAADDVEAFVPSEDPDETLDPFSFLFWPCADLSI